MKFSPDTFTDEVLVGDGFFEFFKSIGKLKIQLPEESEPISLETFLDRPLEGNYVCASDETKAVYFLDAQNGCKLACDGTYLVSAYDESINKYSTLEGKAVYVSHSLVYLFAEKYYPVNQLSTFFVTKSKTISEQITNCILADRWDIDTTANVNVSKQKKEFLNKYACDNCLLLIDGPYIAGDGFAVFKGIVKERFLDHGIIPIFVVKNSNSSLIVDNNLELKGRYNSDLHWASKQLQVGQRTKFFMYTDKVNTDNSKVFCYFKYNSSSSPIRIEIPTQIYEQYKPSISSYLDMIYYFILEQGNFKNPQPRPIAVAEMFARETLHLVKFTEDLRNSGLTPTMNEERGMEYE